LKEAIEAGQVNPMLDTPKPPDKKETLMKKFGLDPNSLNTGGN
jgi:hypothetical protein